MTESVHRPGGVREMMALALPMVVSYACDTAMMFCDRLLLSRLGPDFMNAAVGGGLSAFMMASFGFGLIGYGTALVAQYLGAGRKRMCPVVTVQSLVTALALYPLVLVCAPWMPAVFRELGVPASQLDAQIVYFDIMAAGAIFVFVRHALASYFSGIGRTRVVMAASLVAFVVNAAASYVLIYGQLGLPALGIRGAAIGTLMGSAAGIALLAAAFFGRANRDEFGVGRWGIDPEVLKKLLRYGAPPGFEMALTLIAANAFTMAFHSMGPVVATASSIVMNWDMSAYIPLIGMEVGVTSLVGRYMGAGRPDIAHRATMSGLKIGCIYAAALLVFFGFLAAPLVEVFRPAEASVSFEQARPLAEAMLRLITLYMFSIVLVIVFVGALRGAGDTLWAMVFHISLHWLSAATLYAGTRWLGLSALGAWVLVIVVFMLFSGLAYGRYRAGRWRTLKIIE